MVLVCVGWLPMTNNYENQADPVFADALTQRTRRWIRRDQPVWPFAWRGLVSTLGLLLLAFYALGPFARQDIEANVLQNIRRQLDANGDQWVRVSRVSGQDVRLSGVQPSAGAGNQAIELAGATRCATWAGPLVCPISVTGEFSNPPAPAALEPAMPEASTAAAVATCEHSLADIVAQSKIEFTTSSARIQPRSAPVLDALAVAAKNCPGVIRVEGYTDSTGLPVTNQGLSEARAASVRQALVERGVEDARVKSAGFGPDHPVGDNHTATGRAQNRRIEFRVVSGN
jgi:outer membrane protein OmpA-like peptidoglycan-associated protein